MGRVSDAKERLLNTALKLFWEQTYCSVTVDAICEKAGVKKGSFYYFFKSKADLAAEAIEAHWETYRFTLDEIFSPTIPPLNRLCTYFERSYLYQVQRKNDTGYVCGCPYFDIGAEAATLEPAILGKVQGVMTKYLAYFESTVRDANEQGLISVDDPRKVAKWLFNYYEGSLGAARIQNDPDLLLDLGEGALQLLGAPRST